MAQALAQSAAWLSGHYRMANDDKVTALALTSRLKQNG